MKNMPSKDKKAFVPWQKSLQGIIDEHNAFKQKGRRIVSNETMDARAFILFAGFRTLRELGYKINNPRNFCTTHMKALAAYWEGMGKLPATIQNRISVFRVFAEWIGKPGMIGPSEGFVKDPASVTRQYAAVRDKSWSANNVDFEEILQIAKEVSPYFAMQLELIYAFGLRRKEAVMFHPFRADKGAYIVASDGTKNSRDRVIPVDSPYKRDVLERAKILAKTPNGHVGRPGRSLKSNLKAYDNTMAKLGLTKKGLGVTGHGLRHQYANDGFEHATGCKTPVRGGQPGEVDKDAEMVAKAKISEELGHTRTSITAAYFGRHAAPRKQSSAQSDNVDSRRLLRAFATK